jgi:hypothetical protein
MNTVATYAPPVYLPGKKPLLPHSNELPYQIDFELFARDGWATLDITDSPSDPLFKLFSELFKASSQFLSLSEDEKLKYRVPPGASGQISEEGYSRVEGEKCMIALRKADTTPEIFGLRQKAAESWHGSAVVLNGVLKAIEQSLGMADGALTRTSEAQLELPQEGDKNVATLMRMFRYDRPRSGEPSNVVSETHKDLGMLTIVVGHTPGLECWDTLNEDWVSCETKPGLNASIMVGQTLAKLTNWRYSAGKHRVFVHPIFDAPHLSGVPAPLSDPSYRFSLVHALRGHLPLVVSHAEFETPITGKFDPATHFNVTMSEIYKAISDAHFNVNLTAIDRERQKRAIEGQAKMETKTGWTERSHFKFGHQLSRLSTLLRRSVGKT